LYSELESSSLSLSDVLSSAHFELDWNKA
jgi:hypothetical protein